MAGENPSAAPDQPKNIPGFKGLEHLEHVDALKKGSAFRDFLDKVTAIRTNPEAQKKVTEALRKIDSNPQLTKEQKKEQLRSYSPADLIAVIGKNIEFDEKGVHMTLDFGEYSFAEQEAIGAGHLLPPNVQAVSFGDGQTAKRTAGARGGEYRSRQDRYMSSFTNTKLFIAYKDIAPMNAKQLESATNIEKNAMQKAKVVEEKTHDAQAELRKHEQLTPPKAGADEQSVTGKAGESSESKEIHVSRRPVFIGDSQVEGLRPALARRGIKAFDYRGRRMETIADRISNLPDEERAYIKNADTIVLQCGGNNLASSENYPLEKMQKNLYKLIGAIRAINPDARIRIGTLMPPGSDSRNKETRFAYNAWLKEESARTGRFSVVDTYALTEDPQNPGRRLEKLFGGSANPHLKMREYAKLAPKMLDAINYQG